MKQIILLGSTGSIGTQTLDIVAAHPERFSVSVLCCGKKVDLLREQIRAFSPKAVCVAEEGDAKSLREEFPGLTVLSGDGGLAEAAAMEGDLVVNALVGIRGLLPTLAAVSAGKDIALANKETLVTGGELVMEKVREKGVALLPIDSEHSAIFQCLQGKGPNEIGKILLTASGGPFRGRKYEELRDVTLEQTLAHPNWDMGQKITVDSATMMNKGFEIMEAVHLFGMPQEKVEVVVHPQSIVHSMIAFEDGAVIAQLGTPDMHLPIAYALTYPERMAAEYPVLDIIRDGASLTFESPDENAFPCLRLAREAMAEGGTAPAALNGANEMLVAAFLAGKIPYIAIPEGLMKVMERYENTPLGDISDVLKADETARRLAKEVSGL